MQVRQQIFEILIHMLLLFTAVPVHECAHALTADRLGDPTPRAQGRITLNPFAHLTLWGSLLLIFAGFGWGKPVSVNARNFKNPKRDMALTALAGPVSNLIMAYLSMVIYKVLASGAVLSGMSEGAREITGYVGIIFLMSTYINVGLAVFNFLPVPPLDGSKIFNSILPDRFYWKIMQYERYIIIAVIILLYSGLLSRPLAVCQSAVISCMNFLTGWVDMILPIG
ncbi:MAG: site-2 protease family protein [Oscillospiraceae bacterium]|nr:site-2 protease family protein [Oscillospiraceae bacterium]